MSEALFVSVQTREEAAERSGVGRPLAGVRIAVRKAEEHDADEMAVHAPWSLRTYLLEEGEGSPLPPGGDLPTGDAG